MEQTITDYLDYMTLSKMLTSTNHFDFIIKYNTGTTIKDYTIIKFINYITELSENGVEVIYSYDFINENKLIFQEIYNKQYYKIRVFHDYDITFTDIYFGIYSFVDIFSYNKYVQFYCIVASKRKSVKMLELFMSEHEKITWRPNYYESHIIHAIDIVVENKFIDGFKFLVNYDMFIIHHDILDKLKSIAIENGYVYVMAILDGKNKNHIKFSRDEILKLLYDSIKHNKYDAIDYYINYLGLHDQMANYIKSRRNN